MRNLTAIFCFFILMHLTSDTLAQNSFVWARNKTIAQQAIDSQIADSFNKVPIEDLVVIQEIKPFYILDVKKSSELKTLKISFTRHSRRNKLSYKGNTLIDYCDSQLDEAPISKASFFIDDIDPNSYYDLLRLIRKETRRTYQLTRRTRYVTLNELPVLIEDIQLTPDIEKDKIYLSFLYKDEKITIPVSLSSTVRNRTKEIEKTEDLFSDIQKAEKKSVRKLKKMDRDFATCLRKNETSIRNSACQKFIRGYEVSNGVPIKWYLWWRFRIFYNRRYLSSTYNLDWYLVSNSSRRTFNKFYFDQNNQPLKDQISTAYIIYHDLQLVAVVNHHKIRYYPNNNAELVLILKDGKKARCPISELYLNKNVQLTVTEEENNELDNQVEWIKNV